MQKRGLLANYEASMNKLFSSETEQRIGLEQAPPVPGRFRPAVRRSAGADAIFAGIDLSASHPRRRSAAAPLQESSAT